MALRRAQHCHHAFTRQVLRLDNQMTVMTVLSTLLAIALVAVVAWMSGISIEMQKDTLGALLLIIIATALAPLTPAHLVISGLSPVLSAPRASTTPAQRADMAEKIHRRTRMALLYSMAITLLALLAIFTLLPVTSPQGYVMAAGMFAIMIINLRLLTRHWFSAPAHRPYSEEGVGG